jgi:hypothetical protein
MSNQAPTLHLSYLDCDISDVMPRNSDLDESDSLIDLSIFEKNGNNNASLQNNARPTEAHTSPGVSLIGAVSLPCLYAVSLNSFPSDEAVPMESTEWPADCTWWHQTFSKGMSSSIGDAESQTASISDLQGYDTREISSASSATYLGQCEYGPGWLPGSLEWMKRESITYKQSEKGIDSKDLDHRWFQKVLLTCQKTLYPRTPALARSRNNHNHSPHRRHHYHDPNNSLESAGQQTRAAQKPRRRS